jgi:hypothetical protein
MDTDAALRVKQKFAAKGKAPSREKTERNLSSGPNSGLSGQVDLGSRRQLQVPSHEPPREIWKCNMSHLLCRLAERNALIAVNSFSGPLQASESTTQMTLCPFSDTYLDRIR